MKKNQNLNSHHVVSSYEMDSFGHVNNAVFLNYLEKARCDYMSQKELHFLDFFKWKKYPVVARANLEYKFPAKAGDHLLIKGWISKYSAASFTLRYEIVNQDTQKLILCGETFHIFVDDNNRPSRIPEEFMTKFIMPMAAGRN